MSDDGPERVPDEGGGHASEAESERSREVIRIGSTGGTLDTDGIRTWALLTGNRWVVTGLVLIGLYAVLVGFSQIGLTPHRTIVANQNGLEFVFSAFIGAIITGTSIVVTINQLVLSQELGAVGDQRERMQESIGFRQDVEDEIHDGASPPEPAVFLYELVDGIEDRATRIEASITTAEEEEVRQNISRYVDELTTNAATVKRELKDAQFGTFDVIWAALSFGYSRKIYDGRQIRAAHSDTISSEVTDAIDDTIEVLKFFGPAREHFKTLYFQWELINLSRALLYIAVPALATMGVMLMYVDANALTGSVLGIDVLVWVTGIGFVIGVSPFVVFIAYVLRIATVAKRTLAMGPFILRESERESDVGE